MAIAQRSGYCVPTLLGVRRTLCIRLMRLGITVSFLTGLGFLLTHTGLYRSFILQLESDQSCIQPFCEVKSNASNRLVAFGTWNEDMAEMKGLSKGSRITSTDGTKPGFTPELPIIEAKDQPERLRNLPVFHCYKYTCEKPPGFPELRLNESPVVPSARNVTPGSSSLVVYNRVNKCGSNTLKVYMKRLRGQNHFQMKSSKIVWRRELSWKDQKALATSLTRIHNTPVVFDRHVYFINFTRYGLDTPIWINMVREPVDRFISLFYFHRKLSKWSPSGFLGRAFARPPKWWFDKNLDDCVHMDDPECVLKPGGMRETPLTFFCGHHPACLEIGNRGALQRAKRHVETAYSVVGVLEDLPTSMKVLEYYVPKFFNGISAAFAKESVHANIGKTRQNVTEETKRLLRNMMPLDLDFYDFVKQRLHLQSQRIPE